MGTLLLLDIPKVPSDSTIQELLKSVFGMLGMKNLTRLDSDHMCICIRYILSFIKIGWGDMGGTMSHEMELNILYIGL